MSHFVLMFWRDKPVDMLLDDLMNFKVKRSIKPDQFQHIGHFSSLKGKTQIVQDNSSVKKTSRNTSTGNLTIGLIKLLLSMLLFVFLILLLNVLTFKIAFSLSGS